ncbi:MAG TPA: Flp family type IVb pilin [Bryobacteraceae bacterium]|nr:Flp family type IVb pilin [Bryobacteraceae bacterium]
MKTVRSLKIWKDRRGQDFVEYALIAAFIVTCYGAITPTIAPRVSTVLSRISGTLVKAGG